jgi:hypothetical protein
MPLFFEGGKKTNSNTVIPNFTIHVHVLALKYDLGGLHMFQTKYSQYTLLVFDTYMSMSRVLIMSRKTPKLKYLNS